MGGNRYSEGEGEGGGEGDEDEDDDDEDDDDEEEGISDSAPEHYQSICQGLRSALQLMQRMVLVPSSSR